MLLVSGQFSESFPPIMDGVGNVARNYAYWLNKKYGSCCAVAPAFPKYVDQEEFPVLRYSSIAVITRRPYRTGLPQIDAQFMKKLKSIPFDIVHAHTPFSSGHIALDVARKRGIPIVASFHSKYYDDFIESLKIEGVARYWLAKVIEFYDSVDFVWTVNNSTADTLREYGFKGKIEIVPNGTEFQTAEDKKTECEKVNARLKLHENDLVFIYVGQMIWQKNTRVLLEALAELKKKGLKFKMLMVGHGYAIDDLKELTLSLDLRDRVIFTGLIHDRNYLKSLYCRANLLLFPSLYDNASIVVREAASQECPSLLIAGSNTAEGIVHNYNGFLSEDGALKLSESIMKAVRNPEQLDEVGRNARKTIYTSWESIVDDVYERYCEILRAYKQKGTSSFA